MGTVKIKNKGGSKYDLLDILPTLSKKEIEDFCTKRKIPYFGQDYFSGEVVGLDGNNLQMMDRIAKALLSDIEENAGLINKFHKKMILQILFWYNEFERKDKLPDSIFLLFHKICFPESELHSPLSSAIKEFVACFLVLAPRKKDGSYNISLGARALKYISPNITFETARRTIYRLLKSKEMSNLIAFKSRYKMDKINFAVSIEMGVAIQKIHEGKIGLNHRDLAEKGQQIGELVSNLLTFDKLYEAIKK